MDDYSVLMDELRCVLKYDVPRDLLPTVADYVRSRRHVWKICARGRPKTIAKSSDSTALIPYIPTDSGDWTIRGNIAERRQPIDAAGWTNWTMTIRGNEAVNIRSQAVSYGIVSTTTIDDGPSSWTIDIASAGADFGQLRAMVGVVELIDDVDVERNRIYMQYVYRPLANGNILPYARYKFAPSFRIKILTDPTKRTVVARFLAGTKSHRPITAVLNSNPHLQPRDFSALRPFVILFESGQTKIS